MDDLISSVATEDCKAYALSGARQCGTFTNLSSREFMKVVAKLTKLQAWTSDIMKQVAIVLKELLDFLVSYI